MATLTFQNQNFQIVESAEEYLVGLDQDEVLQRMEESLGTAPETWEYDREDEDEYERIGNLQEEYAKAEQKYLQKLHIAFYKQVPALLGNKAVIRDASNVAPYYWTTKDFDY
jgi:Lhr-like helicase